VTRSSRDQLNGIYAGAAICLGALVGAASGSGFLFLLVAGGLIGMFMSTGQIRMSGGLKRGRRK
jgi:hypothetical protein